MSTGLANLVAKTLAQSGGFLIWPEKTDEGVLQPFVLDLTTVLSHPDVFNRVASGLIRIVRNKAGMNIFNSVAGVPLAGIPYASYIALKTGKPMLLVRCDSKTRSVEGLLKMGDRVLIVDDFVVTGRQILKTAERIVSDGGVVEQAVVVVCQSRNTVERLFKNGIKLHYLIDFKSLVEGLRKLDALTDEEYENLVSRS